MIFTEARVLDTPIVSADFLLLTNFLRTEKMALSLLLTIWPRISIGF